MPEHPKVAIFWFRRDLRLEDNAGLSQALKAGTPVLPLFIFDRTILDKLDDRDDARVTFIHQKLTALDRQLKAWGSGLCVRYGTPEQVFRELLESYTVTGVFTNRDYEPYARQRDKAIAAMLRDHGCLLHTYKDQVIFEQAEVVKADGNPYTVYTPYSRKWREHLTDDALVHFEVAQHHTAFFSGAFEAIPTLASMGFQESGLAFPTTDLDLGLVKQYRSQRDFPARPGTTRLGLHLRFGTVSVRQLVRAGLDVSGTWVSELIWREFFAMILWHFPHVVDRAFRPAYDRIQWRNDEAEFEAWCKGQTGYPIVDAGMRELNATGFMHNRVRMVVASFLSKHLLIDWRWGEAYFARKLLDFDLASNNGNWQWAAGCGCDAAPYFRVFNPELQTKRFDAKHAYIRQWVPEYQELTYPRPLVEHKMARERALAVYKAAVKP
ncbi:MAG: deoxyribodipyrimidine photo-lyase [Bacteroidota bacterium]